MLVPALKWCLTWLLAGFGLAAGVALLIGLVQAAFYLWERFLPAEPEGEKPCRFCLQDEVDRRPVVVSFSGTRPMTVDRPTGD